MRFGDQQFCIQLIYHFHDFVNLDCISHMHHWPSPLQTEEEEILSALQDVICGICCKFSLLSCKSQPETYKPQEKLFLMAFFYLPVVAYLLSLAFQFRLWTLFWRDQARSIHDSEAVVALPLAPHQVACALVTLQEAAAGYVTTSSSWIQFGETSLFCSYGSQHNGSPGATQCQQQWQL